MTKVDVGYREKEKEADPAKKVIFYTFIFFQQCPSCGEAIVYLVISTKYLDYWTPGMENQQPTVDLKTILLSPKTSK
jgi:hypothetical protein